MDDCAGSLFVLYASVLQIQKTQFLLALYGEIRVVLAVWTYFVYIYIFFFLRAAYTSHKGVVAGILSNIFNKER